MTLELFTIGISHYCENARWALDRAGLEYRESAHPPIVHYMTTLRHGTRRTLPALKTPHGTLVDSTEILHYADRATPGARLFPESPTELRETEELENFFDERLGPATRKWAYSWGLRDRALLVKLMQIGATSGEARLLRWSAPAIISFMKKGLGLSESAIDKSQARIAEIFENVGERLAGKKYLVSDRFGAADLTFAALAAPCVLAPNYGLGMAEMGELPEEMQRAIEAMRKTPAGDFALRIYRDHRREVVR